jgi:hypothetical protein
MAKAISGAIAWIITVLLYGPVLIFIGQGGASVAQDWGFNRLYGAFVALIWFGALVEFIIWSHRK